MTLIFPTLMFVIFIACVACLYTEGTWGNAIRLINVVTAALLATNFFEPVADKLEEMGAWFGSLTYVWDFLALWGLFTVWMVVLRLATDYISRVKVRFLSIADRIGSAILAAWIGWVIVCFTTMSLHTAPLARDFMFKGFGGERREKFMGMPTDRQWLGFMQKTSYGVFCRSGTELGKNEKTVFDPKGEFMPRYSARRANLEANVNKTNGIRVR